jgi:hypothetical protein
MSNALAQASWVEADEALAEALVEFAELARVLTKPPETFTMASQALSRVARRRDLELFGEIGATAPLDRDLHELSGSSASTGSVRILREGVMRGRDVLIRALVKPARRPAKKTRR